MKETISAVCQLGETPKHFCSCPVTQCPRHPLNHDKGCDLCIRDNLEKGKMPACMFKAVSEDVSDAKDWTIKGFVDFYLKHNKNHNLEK